MSNALAVMSPSLMLAQIIGPVFLVIGLAVLFNSRSFTAMIDEMSEGKQHLGMFITGMVTFILGLLVVLTHNLWVWNWPVLITIVGWLTLLKGLVILWLPGMSTSVAKYYKGKTGFLMFAGVVAIVIGLVLGYYGFMM